MNMNTREANWHAYLWLSVHINNGAVGVRGNRSSIASVSDLPAPTRLRVECVEGFEAVLVEDIINLQLVLVPPSQTRNKDVDRAIPSPVKVELHLRHFGANRPVFLMRAGRLVRCQRCRLAGVFGRGSLFNFSHALSLSSENQTKIAVLNKLFQKMKLRHFLNINKVFVLIPSILNVLQGKCTTFNKY